MCHVDIIDSSEIGLKMFWFIDVNTDTTEWNMMWKKGSGKKPSLKTHNLKLILFDDYKHKSSLLKMCKMCRFSTFSGVNMVVSLSSPISVGFLYV